MLEDKEAVRRARIEIEKITAPVLLLSAKKDEMWPSTDMANHMMRHLDSVGFTYPHTHIAFEGGHAEPLQHFDAVFEFLEKHVEN